MNQQAVEHAQNVATPPAQQEGLRWHSAHTPPFAVAGLPWFKENGGSFHRLPNRAKGVVRDILWILSSMPSGGRVRFKTDSSTLRVRIQHGRLLLAMPHMSAVGVSGLDLYEGPPKKMSFWASGVPGDPMQPYVVSLFAGLPRKMRELTIYLPAFNDVLQFAIGLDPDARIVAPTPFGFKKPVLIYGTSVTHGGCSARTGTGYVSIVGRQLGIDAVNLGFSSNGICDPELVGFFTGIDPACVVVDCIANMNLERMQTAYGPFVDGLRARRPELPLVLATKFRTSHERFAGFAGSDKINAIVLKKYQQMRRRGDRHVYLIDWRDFIGGELDHPTVDGVHPTDLGFQQMADGLCPLLKRILRLA